MKLRNIIRFIIPGSLLAIITAIYAGPFWPMPPTLHPNNQAVDPLSVPFDIENTSALFPIDIRFVFCRIFGPFNSLTSTAYISDMGLGFPFRVTVPPKKKVQYSACNLDLNIYRSTPFSMCFVILYQPSVLEFWKEEEAYTTDIFRWKNGHWSEGISLPGEPTCDPPTIFHPQPGNSVPIPPRIVSPPTAATPLISGLPSPEKGTGYRALLMAWLEAHKRYPLTAHLRGEGGRVGLRFTVDRSGRVIDYAIIKSSGYPDLDASVEEMMRGATLPPFPAPMKQNQIEVSVTIGFSPRSLEQAPSL
jgi:TonB family protein